MIASIDDHREACGVEPICRVLPSPRRPTMAMRRGDPGRLAARERSEAGLMIEIRRVFDDNFRVCGVRKTWRQLAGTGSWSPVAPSLG